MKITKRLAKRGGSYSSKQLDSVTKLLYKRACQRAFSRFPLHSSPTILCIQCLSRTGRNLWTTLFPCTSIPHNLTTDLTRHSFNEQRNMPNIASPLMTNKGKIRRGGTLIRATFIAWKYPSSSSLYLFLDTKFHRLQVNSSKSFSSSLYQYPYRASISSLNQSSLYDLLFFQEKKKNLVTSSLKGLGKRELGNKDRITFFLSKSSLGVKRCASKAQREDSRRACVHAHTRPEKWFGGSLVRKKRKKNRKKEKEAKTKRGKKVEHNGKRKEWTSLKKPGAQGGGSGEEEEEARHQEETEKNRATKSETPAAVNIAFAGCVLLVVHECCIPVKRVLFVRTICTRVSRMPMHFLWRDGSKLRRRSRNFDTRLYCGIVVCRFS